MVNFLQEADTLIAALTKADKIARESKTKPQPPFARHSITPEQTIITSSETGSDWRVVPPHRRRNYLGASWIQSTSKIKSTSPRISKSLLRLWGFRHNASTPRKKMHRDLRQMSEEAQTLAARGRNYRPFVIETLNSVIDTYNQYHDFTRREPVDRNPLEPYFCQGHVKHATWTSFSRCTLAAGMDKDRTPLIVDWRVLLPRRTN